MEILSYLAIFFMGTVLGLFGAGGSILSVPILVYTFNMSHNVASTYSLIIVGFAAALGSINSIYKGNICLRALYFFGIPSILVVFLARALIYNAIPEQILFFNKDDMMMVILSVFMIFSGLSMMRQKQVSNEKPTKVKLIIYSILVGFAAGMLGIGGGFMIVPILVTYLRIPMLEAIGTSLLIISLNSFAGFFGDIFVGKAVDMILLIQLALAMAAGILLGTLLPKLTNCDLKICFSFFVVIVGFVVLVTELISILM
jgi:uncharacterized membrane protein YfcA